MGARRRLDQELVRRGLAPSRAVARELIDRGAVTVGGAPAAKAARQVLPGDAIEVSGDGPRFVSRAGDKLDGALDRLGVDCVGRRVLDAGASTGGFTDCVLQRGAAGVIAVDVGRAQLHERVAGDHRVEVRDRTNARSLDAAALGGPVDLVVADLSFISITTVLDALLSCVSPDGDLVLLVKPQFEAGRAEVGRGKGVVRDPAVWRRVLGEVIDAARRSGATIMGAVVSSRPGADGNVEFFVHLRRSPAGASGAVVGPVPEDTTVDDLLDAVVREAVELAGARRGPEGS